MSRPDALPMLPEITLEEWPTPTPSADPGPLPEPASTDREPVPPLAGKGLPRAVGHALGSASDWLFGAFALVLGLSVLSAAPVLQLLSFGYLLEAGGRVARTGRLRDALIGVRKAARVGRIVIGCWLALLPLRLVSSLAASAQVIDPGGPIAARWRAGLLVLAVLTALHVTAACARGGRLRDFLWPFPQPFWLFRRLRRGGFFAASRDAVWDFVASLNLPHYFRIGFLGFVGTMAWLVVPVSLMAAGRRVPPLGLVGALCLGVVALALPFLQARFAAENRLAALFDYRTIRRRFLRAPWAFATALLLTLVSAVPLYLLKIEMIPRETAWLPSLVFILFMFPARVVTGWAYARSVRRDRPRHWFFRGTARLGLLPIAVFYVLIVFFSQFTAWQGIWSLYEQHAFLIPVPFLSM